jgi:ubiquinone/menaquinone biosynthesis C-methylase UbiE
MPFDHFSVIAGIYNRWGKFTAPPEFLDLLSLPQKGRLLDIGGGTGRVIDSLRYRVRAPVLVDPSISMLHYSIARELPSVCAPAEHLPLASRSFDRIMMVDALHHVKNQKKTADELWRVLVPGGRLVILEPDINKFGVIMIAVMERILFMRSHFLNEDGIRLLFSKYSPNIQVVHSGNNLLTCLEKNQ